MSDLLTQSESVESNQYMMELQRRRWPDGISCPKCESKNPHRWRVNYFGCRNRQCRHNYSVSSGTIMQGLKLKPATVLAIREMLARGASANQIEIQIGVCQRTAHEWVRIKNDILELLGRDVSCETHL